MDTALTGSSSGRVAGVSCGRMDVRFVDYPECLMRPNPNAPEELGSAELSFQTDRVVNNRAARH